MVLPLELYLGKNQVGRIIIKKILIQLKCIQILNQLWGIINDFKNSFSTCKLMYRVVHRRSTPPELFRYCMILKDLVFEFISKSSRKIQQGCRIGTPNFWQSVNPILSRGNRLCPPHYNCDLQIFAPSGIPDGTYQTKVS